jgi:serine/threonine protein kinase
MQANAAQGVCAPCPRSKGASEAMSNGQADYLHADIGNYHLTDRIADGGSGTVYLAEHLILKGRLAAIKLLHTHLTTTEDQERFLQEAQLLERLKHPRILPMYDVGFYQNLPYIVTEYVSGGSLRDLLDKHSGLPLPWDQALSILT